MQILRQASFIANPWKNGGGVTREAIRVPREGSAFRWRVSVAHIDASGPFSEFADYQRRMVLLRGAGVRLTFGGKHAHSLSRVGDLVEFDGAATTECELLDGPCVDLNLMTAKTLDGVNAWVEAVDHESRIAITSGGRIGLIFAVSGNLAIETSFSCAASTHAASTHAALAHNASIHSAADELVILEPWDLAILGFWETATIAPTAGTSFLMAETPVPLVFFATLDDNSPGS